MSKKHRAPAVKIDDSDRKGTVYASGVPDCDRLRVFGRIRLGNTVSVSTIDGGEWRVAKGTVIFVHPRGRFFTIRREFNGPWPGAYNECFMLPRAGAAG